MKIVAACPEDAAELSSIAHSAKGHWGYPESWINHWRDVLTITPGYIGANPTYCAISDERIIGFCALVLRDGEAYLDHLWVLPSAIGRGAGRILFEFAENFARTSGATIIRVESDPHAEEFYVHMGATKYGQVSANMDGHERFLPLLEKAL
jgi:GNAT superfamily N-acetyltransferase